MSMSPPPENSARRGVSLRISQVFSACSFCKGRKIKCDGVGPVCDVCMRSGRGSECSLSSETYGRDYPTHLQDRLQQLQTELQRRRREHRSVPSAADGTLDEENQQSMLNTLITEIGAFPILASSYAAAFNGPSLSTIVLAAASSSPPSSPLSPSIPSAPHASLPKKSIALKLAKHYMTHIYPRLPFFSVHGFYAQLNHVYASDPAAPDPSMSAFDAAGMPCTLDSVDPSPQQQAYPDGAPMDQGYSFFTVLLVLAIATSTLSRCTDRMVSDQVRRLFHAAVVFRESAILPNTIGGVQSLLFLIQFATLNPSILDAWYLIGLGMRSCIDLGLHQDPLGPISPSLLETRRRLWWSMYSFDRSMSLGCGRPTEIPDAVISASLPTFKIESTATDIEVEGYLQRYRSLQLQSLIHDRLNSSSEHADDGPEVVSGLRRKLTQWRDANPAMHCRTLFDSEWLMSKMLLLRPCRLLPERSPRELAELWESAVGFAALYRKLVESNSIFYVQIASEKIYWTGLAMLYSYWKRRRGSEQPYIGPIDLWMAVQNVTFILQTLSVRWEHGKILVRSFEATSGRVVALMEAGVDQGGLAAALPADVVNFKDYSSLTSIHVAASGIQSYGISDGEADGELWELISEMN